MTAEHTSASPPVVTPMNSLTNLTPYTMTLLSTDVTKVGGVQPPTTVLPGQTAAWNGTDHYGGLRTIYQFTDASGGRHQVLLDLEQGGVGFLAYSYDYGWDANMGENDFHNSTAYFHMVTNGGHTDAVWNTPTTVTIDANTDPASAAAAVNYELPRATGPQTWTPKPGSTPNFEWEPLTRATSMVYNFSSSPVTVAKGQETTKGESTSIGEELTYSQSVNVYGIVNKAAASFTSDQEWASSDSVDVDVDTEVEPGNVGWINKRTSVASLTGDLVFTTTEGITFRLDNVTISKGDIVNTGAGGVPVGMDFTPYQEPATPGAH